MIQQGYGKWYWLTFTKWSHVIYDAIYVPSYDYGTTTIRRSKKL